MNALIAFSIKQRVLVIALFVMTFVGGLFAFKQLNIEAYPDPTPPMVDVITQSPGLSAEEIERYITIPIETQTSALRNLNSVPHNFALRAFRREAPVHVRLQLRRSLATGTQSLVATSSAFERRPAANIPGQPDRRNLPVQACWPAGHGRSGTQDTSGLGSSTPVSLCSWRCRCHGLGWKNKDV